MRPPDPLFVDEITLGLEQAAGVVDRDRQLPTGQSLDARGAPTSSRVMAASAVASAMPETSMWNRQICAAFATGRAPVATGVRQLTEAMVVSGLGHLEQLTGMLLGHPWRRPPSPVDGTPSILRTQPSRGSLGHDSHLETLGAGAKVFEQPQALTHLAPSEGPQRARVAGRQGTRGRRACDSTGRPPKASDWAGAADMTTTLTDPTDSAALASLSKSPAAQDISSSNCQGKGSACGGSECWD